MKPALALLLPLSLLLLHAFPRPATALCVPRNSSNPINLAALPPPSSTTTSSPATPSPALKSPSQPSKPSQLPPSNATPTPATPSPPLKSSSPPTQPSQLTPSPPAFSQPAAVVSTQLPTHLPLPNLLPFAGAVSALCGHTDYPEVCASSILPLQHPPGFVGPAALLKLQLQACRAQAEKARAHIAALSGLTGTKARDASSLQDCDDNYDDVLDNLDEAAAALASKDKGTLKTMLSALITDFSTCDDGFTEMAKVSPLAVIDDMLSKLASNCLAIAALV
ncbi:hypothetical protein B296_00016226 [Ensete ventricosum]|uniref:Pectinesterase inhibitor domain-containing protein n=1 Tax=Ensete ventricosum TaxID=4639 RepID=A0A426Z8D6_ENSVE|nr:hypothetical protein B296_00016226 [Ensete ventricosum]